MLHHTISSFGSPVWHQIIRICVILAVINSLEDTNTPGSNALFLLQYNEQGIMRLTVCYILAKLELRGDKVLRKIEMAIYNHQADCSFYLRPDVVLGNWQTQKKYG